MKRLDAPSALFIVIWTSGYVVGSVAAKAASPLAVTFWRIALATVIFAWLAKRRDAQWPTDRRLVGQIALAGVVLFAVQFGALYTALGEGMPAGTAALIVSCCPLLVAVTEHRLGSERLGARQWLGVGFGAAGVVLALLDRISRPHSLTPVLWTLLALAGFAIGTMLQRRLPAGADARAISAIQCAASAVLLAPIAAFSGGLGIPFTSPALGATAWLTIVNALGGPLVFLALVRSRGATRASSLLFVVPATTAIASWPILGQRLGLTAVLGLVVAGLGVTLMQLQSKPSVLAARPPIGGKIAESSALHVYSDGGSDSDVADRVVGTR